ncbi:hypothetical protein DFP73DRAFT_548494, partial [Morchella snyderi]
MAASPIPLHLMFWLGPSTLGRCKGFCFLFPVFCFLSSASACLPCLLVGYFFPGTRQGGLVHAKQIHLLPGSYV